MATVKQLLLEAIPQGVGIKCAHVSTVLESIDRIDSEFLEDHFLRIGGDVEEFLNLLDFEANHSSPKLCLNVLTAVVWLEDGTHLYYDHSELDGEVGVWVHPQIPPIPTACL